MEGYVVPEIRLIPAIQVVDKMSAEEYKIRRHCWTPEMAPHGQGPRRQDRTYFLGVRYGNLAFYNRNSTLIWREEGLEDSVALWIIRVAILAYMRGKDLSPARIDRCLG